LRLCFSRGLGCRIGHDLLEQRNYVPVQQDNADGLNDQQQWIQPATPNFTR
jgi:hypothetical protein